MAVSNFFPNLQIFPHFLLPKPFSLGFSRTVPAATPLRRAVREWREYEDAVKRKDLAGALRFLKSLETERQEEQLLDGVSLPTELTRLRFLESERFGPQRDWEVLDTCLNADDMKLVANAYKFLKDRGFLPNFGKCRNIVLEGTRKVTPDVLSYSTGLEVILGLAAADAIFLGGTCLAQISSYWPPFRRRILVHEAGHLLTAYLMGCPIRGVILDPIVAMQMGIQGQAGTQFWDEKVANNLAEGRLDGTTFDRYCMVLFAGIAAEALVYGEAEGGENDENLFRGICLLLDPPLSTAEMSNQARWSVLQSYNLLKWHRAAHRAAIKALESGGSMSVVIRSIEETLYSKI
ncbi:hypothetical protein PHAVU_005G030300 [Phaseolus vulgaris]|uniref:uncharacterized protein isoform X2 n=1 Tax=Phaseolus vulgaris TaxID=3885 RepID=UPI0035C9777C